MTCAIHSYRLDGRCFVCGHVNEAIRADQAEADARHREYAKAAAHTLPPEIEAAIKNDRRGLADSLASLRTAITSALAAAREAGRREVLEGATGVEEAIRDLVVAARDVESHSEEMTMRRRHVQAVEGLAAAQDAIRLAIAADKARAVEGLRPVLSREDAERMIVALESECAHNLDELDAAIAEGNMPFPPQRPCLSTARASLLDALTGAGGGS